MEKALAERVHRLARLPSLTEVTVVTRVPAGILAGVRQALLSGETHYTARPGIPELRAKVAERLALSDRTADEVIITSGEREAIFVARLALGLDPLSFQEVLPSSMIVGTLDDLPGLSSFRVGFVCAPRELASEIRTWKQALSICSAAPSQRAALVALSK